MENVFIIILILVSVTALITGSIQDARKEAIRYVVTIDATKTEKTLLRQIKPLTISFKFSMRDWFVYPEVYDCVSSRIKQEKEAARIKEAASIETLRETWSCN